MCGPWCFDIVRRAVVYFPPRPRVLEVGAYNVNGSVRGVVEPIAESYIGVDIQPGAGVDLVVDAENIINVFEEVQFDVVISTEMLEHVQNWPLIVHNLIAATRIGGIMVLTTRDVGMYWHGFPGDYWRFSPDDLRRIFEPIGEIISAEKDTDDQAWGSGVIVRRVVDDLSGWREALNAVPIHGVDTAPIAYNEWKP
jgi:hypothetical protein